MALRTLVLLALALPGCLPGPLSLGDDGSSDAGSGSADATADGTDTDGPPLAEGEVRWSSVRADITGIDLAVAPDGSFYVVGLSGFTQEGDGGVYDDVWLGKHDAEGQLLWEIFTPQAEAEFAYPVAISVDDAGDLYFATIDYSVTADGNNRVRKLDPEGQELWSTVMPGRLGNIVAQPGGGAIAVGSQDLSAWAQQLDGDGNLGWSRSFGDDPMAYSEISSVALTDDGGVVLGGRLGIQPGSSRSRAWAAEIELADGSDRWQTWLSDAVATDGVADVGITADGTALFAGRSDQAWVKAIAPDGVPEWTWPNDVVEGTASLAVYPDGGFAMGDGRYLDMADPEACFDGFGPCPAIMRVQRLQPDRTPAWQLETSECNAATVVAPTADGGLLVVAACNANGAEVGLGLFRFEP